MFTCCYTLNVFMVKALDKIRAPRVLTETSCTVAKDGVEVKVSHVGSK